MKDQPSRADAFMALLGSDAYDAAGWVLDTPYVLDLYCNDAVPLEAIMALWTYYKLMQVQEGL